MQSSKSSKCREASGEGGEQRAHGMETVITAALSDLSQLYTLAFLCICDLSVLWTQVSRNAYGLSPRPFTLLRIPVSAADSH